LLQFVIRHAEHVVFPSKGHSARKEEHSFTHDPEAHEKS
jgi:hypothetical protein